MQDQADRVTAGEVRTTRSPCVIAGSSPILKLHKRSPSDRGSSMNQLAAEGGGGEQLTELIRQHTPASLSSTRSLPWSGRPSATRTCFAASMNSPTVSDRSVPPLGSVDFLSTTLARESLTRQAKPYSRDRRHHCGRGCQAGTLDESLATMQRSIFCGGKLRNSGSRSRLLVFLRWA